jgi:hypothetical protein
VCPSWILNSPFFFFSSLSFQIKGWKKKYPHINGENLLSIFS